jgi:hypothetical protein
VSNAHLGNYSYYELINLLAGLKYNQNSAEMPAPIAGSFTVNPNDNCWKKCSNDWSQNILGKTLINARPEPDTKCSGYHEKFWSYVYLFKRTDQWTPDFSLEPGAKNDKFQ